MSNSTEPSTSLSGDPLLMVLERERRRRHQSRLAANAATIERWRNDFVGFAAELDVIDKDGNRIPIRPTSMLAEFERQRTGRDIVLKPRQVYFTTWELARDLWFWLTKGAAHVTVICQSDKDNSAIRELITRLNVMLGLDSPPEQKKGLIGRHPWLRELIRWHRGELRFGPARVEVKGAGASRAAAEKIGRSGTNQRVHITEMSSFEFAESTYNAVEPTVPNIPGTEITVESTARGAAGLFFEMYSKAKAGIGTFATFFFAWLRHPEYRTLLDAGEKITPETPRERELARRHGATPEQIKWYRLKVADRGQALVDQEYPLDEETCWLMSGRVYFDPERTRALFAETSDPIRTQHFESSVPEEGVRNELRVWSEPKIRARYVIAADPSEGVVGGDPCAAAIYNRATGEHVASLHGLWRTHEYAAILDEVGRYFNEALIVVERINHGHAVLNALLRLDVREDEVSMRPAYPNVYFDPDDKRPGWKTGNIPRTTALESFEQAHRSEMWSTPDREALNEMQRFVVWPTGKAAAAAGAHDDRVMAHVIAWSVLSRPYVFGAQSVPGSGTRWGDSVRGF